MHIRIRRNKRLGEVLVAEGRKVATLQGGRILSWSPYATEEERSACERWLAARTAPIQDAEWPGALPETYRRPQVAIASVLAGRRWDKAWSRWGPHPRLPERVVLRAEAGTPPPAQGRLHGPDEPVTEEEREHYRREAERLGLEIVDIDRDVRIWRGDPWYQPLIHEAPLDYDAERAAAAATMTLTSEHAIVWVRPTLADVTDRRCRWTAGVGIGSHAQALPLSYGAPQEALDRALALWRAGLRAAVERIHAARGGTLTGWGVPVVPRDRPRLLRPDREGDLWGLLREDLARDPAPRTGLEAVTGLYADGTPYV